MDGRSIPGYYWDGTLRKYFKILPTHAAPPGARYSKENVLRAREENKKRKRVQTETQSRRQQLVQRGKILSSASAAGIALGRELGYDGRQFKREVVRTKAFTEQLDRQIPVLWRQGQITAFDYDRATGGMVIGSGDATEETYLLSLPFRAKRNAHAQSQLSEDDGIPLDVFRSPIMSVCITSTRNLIASTMGGSDVPSIYVAKLIPSEYLTQSSTPESLFSINFQVSTRTIWTSAYNAMYAGSSQRIAFGTASKLLHLVVPQGSEEHSLETALSTVSDVLAVGWISPNTVAAGLRNREVLLWDARSRGTAACLHHEEPICNLSRAGSEYHILVAGLNDTMSLYDLRMRRLQRHGSRELSRSQLGQEKGAGPVCPTQPLLRFSDYANKYNYPIGFDVNTELGLVAAGDNEGRVRTFSLHTGKRMKLDAEQFPLRDKGDRVVRCVQFVDDERGFTRLLASRGSEIAEYMW